MKDVAVAVKRPPKTFKTRSLCTTSFTILVLFSLSSTRLLLILFHFCKHNRVMLCSLSPCAFSPIKEKKYTRHDEKGVVSICRSRTSCCPTTSHRRCMFQVIISRKDFRFLFSLPITPSALKAIYLW